MSNSKRLCKGCKRFKPVSNGIVAGLGFFCSNDCRFSFAMNNTKKIVSKVKETKQKEQRKSDKAKKKELMTRREWYDKLQALVNQYVKIRDAKEPCCTCGTTNPNIKYDAGHFIPQKGVDPRRFELTNIHKQCSLNCNQHGSGKRAEYREFIREKYGDSHLEWLESDINHKSLKDRFPHWEDIEKEILRYRIKIRELGFTPVK
jgi:hypothetical protein